MCIRDSSKSLIAAAKRAEVQRKGGLGVAGHAPGIDFAAVKDAVAATIARIAPVDSQERFEGFGVTVIRDWAKFVSPREVQAGGRVIPARPFVIATGSRPFVPDGPGLDAIP